MNSPSERDSSQQLRPVFSGDVVDFRQLARALWRSRWIVSAMALVGGVAGGGMSLLSTTYVAEGLFLTPSLTVPAFKQYEVALSSEQRMKSFIRLRQLEGTQSEGLLTRLIDVPGALSESVRPAFSLTGREARAYDITFEEKTDGAELLGVYLALKRPRVTDEAPILHLADYVRHTMIEVDLRDEMLRQCLRYQVIERELRNQQIESDFEVDEARQRSESLQQIIATIPGAAAEHGRQVVSLQRGGERFLSPTAQLIAVEVSIADSALADIRRRRENIAAAVKREYYCQAQKVQQDPLIGQEFLRRLSDVHDEVFKGKDLTQDILEQTSNELALQRQAWVHRYIERARFVVPPEGGERRRRTPSLTSGFLFGLIMGGLLGLIGALWLAWWHDNREIVLAADDG